MSGLCGPMPSASFESAVSEGAGSSGAGEGAGNDSGVTFDDGSGGEGDRAASRVLGAGVLEGTLPARGSAEVSTDGAGEGSSTSSSSVAEGARSGKGTEAG